MLKTPHISSHKENSTESQKYIFVKYSNVGGRNDRALAKSMLMALTTRQNEGFTLCCLWLGCLVRGGHLSEGLCVTQRLQKKNQLDIM